MRLPQWLGRWWEPSIGKALLIGLAIRVFLLPWFNNPYNFWGSYMATDLLVQGFDPFQVFTEDPRLAELQPWGYPAFYFLFTTFAYGASFGDTFLYGVWLRLPSVFFDLGTTILLFRIARLMGGSQKLARLVALAFLFNPFSILVTSVWGTNDPIPIFFSVLGIFYILRGQDRDSSRGALALGLGIAIKLYPLLLVPIGLARLSKLRERMRFAALAFLVPLAISAPFLITNASSYLRVLFGFASGQGEPLAGPTLPLLDPQFTILQGISWVAGPIGLEVAFLLASILGIGLYWTYLRVKTGRLHPVLASGFVLALAWLLSVRWSFNYVLWIVPFTTIFAVLRLSGWRKWLVGTFWAPAMVFGLVYDGWYPDPFSGASGLPYPMLISFASNLRVHEWFPYYLAAVLVTSVIGMTLYVFWSLARAGNLRQVGPRKSINLTSRDRSVSTDLIFARRVSKGLAISLLLALLIASVSIQLSNRNPVTPRDFGMLEIDQNGRVSEQENFRALILPFMWIFRGTGRYVLQANGTDGVLIDTVTPAGVASLERALGSDFLSTVITFRIVERYGPQPLIITRGLGGWFGIVSGRMDESDVFSYVDEVTNESHELGFVSESWHTVSLTSSKHERRISIEDETLVLPAAGPAHDISIGHGLAFEKGGGAFITSKLITIRLGATRPPDPQQVIAVVGSSGFLSILAAVLYIHKGGRIRS